MANDLNRSIKIFIDGTPAAKGIAPVEAAIKKLEAQLAALNKGEADYNEKSKKLKQELAAKNRTLQNYKTKVQETDRVLKDLSGATYNELLAVQQQVRKQMRESVRGTRQYNAALEQNKRVAQELAKAQKEMRVEVGCQGSTFGKAINVFNKYAAIVTAGIAAITGAVLKLNELRKKRNEREEAKADVKALTGLDEASVAWLEQQAKKLSTSMDENGIRIRKSATQILDSYKLVGSAKPELLSDKEALAEVTKQTLILASASDMQLKNAVDAVTLSMNQYGDSADQASRYANALAAGSKYGAAAVESVTTAVTKSGVAASSAGIPIEQLVGTIETLAEKGIKDEIAGTGLKKFFLTLQTGADETNPKIVGLETALANLQKQQLSAAEVKKMFGEEGYNVASVLINEAEKVKYYTQAVTGTTVAVEQAATKSATAAAKLDQAKNKMNEMGIELLEKLNPAIISSMNGVVNWSRKFIDLVDFVAQHTGVFFTLTTAIVSYYTATKLAALYETKLKDAKLLSLAADKIKDTWNRIVLASTLALSAAKYALAGNTQMAATAMHRFNIVLKGNPIGVVVSIVSTLAVGLYQLVKRTDDNTSAMRRFNQEMLTEERTLNSLFDTLKRTAPGTQERRDLIQEINDKYGTYLPNLLTEKSSLDEINAAYKRISATLVKQIALKYKNEEIGEVVSEAAKEQVDSIENIRASLEKQLGSGKIANMAIADLKRITTEFYNAGSSWDKAFNQAHHTIKAKYFGRNSLATGFTNDMANFVKSVYHMNREIAKVEKKYASWSTPPPANELPEVTVTGNKNNAGSGSKRLSDEEKKKLEQQRKSALEKEKALYTQQQAELTNLYTEGKDKELQTEQQYNARLLALKKEHLQRVIAISGKGSTEAADAEKQLAEAKLKERQDALSRAVEEENRRYEEQQRQLKESYASGQDENLNSYELYTEAKEQLEIAHLQRMLELAGLDADARKRIEDQLLEYRLKCRKELEETEKKRSKEETASTQKDSKTLEKEYKQRYDRIQGYAEEFGSALGDVVSGQKSALEALGDAAIDVVFDVLKQMINAWMTELAGEAATATAKGTMKEIGSKGIAGIGTSAIIAAAVSGLLTAASSTLKGLLGKSSRSSSGGTSDSGTQTYNRVAVNQHASGRYSVIGAEDGRTYPDIPYIGDAPTGIVRSPALISENGAELIVNAPDLQRLKQHINYPLVVQAINESRRGSANAVPQRAAGSYESIDANATPANGVSPDAVALMERLTTVIERIERNGIAADVVLSELERKQKQRERSRKIGSK